MTGPSIYWYLTRATGAMALILLTLALVVGIAAIGRVQAPLWLGLGAVSFDLMLAIVISSLVRRRLGHTTWRAIHWLAYASWPVAVLHGFGTGSDVRQTWMLAIDVVCIGAVLASIVARAMIGWPDNARLRVGALGLASAFALGLIVWLPGGPLAKGWARRAGTPPSLLGHAARTGRT